MSTLYLLNSPIFTGWGEYTFQPVTLDEARRLVVHSFVSAIGHASTAEIMSMILQVGVPVNRIAIQMQSGDQALVFRLKTRLPEGKVLSLEEMRQVEYEFGLLIMK